MDYFAELKEKLASYLDSDAIAKIEAAYQLSYQAHDGQMRSSGEPYIIHPVAVAGILADLRLDQESIMAALLHDVIEDTKTDKSYIAEHFGEQVAELVDGVSKLTQIKFETRAEAQAENFRKMVLAMVRDIRVILVKLADRLHNMRTLDYLSYEKRVRKAHETLEIYAPIANRLGMHEFRIEFEELCFAALHPLRYRVLREAVSGARGNREQVLEDIKQVLVQAFTDANVTAKSVRGREKHLYSIYKKMRQKRLRFAEILDIYAFRIIADSVDTCYRMLGIVHRLYKPVPERFKDYIAIPKTNGYQSLHTTVFGPFGLPIEIQIRTEDMNRMANTGIAAHWRYKMTDDEEQRPDDHRAAQDRARHWVKDLLEMQDNAGNSLEFIENVKIDLFPDEVYVFTPKGKILQLPAGATAVDFAYAVHSDIGNTCVAAKIDRRLAPLSTQLGNGQSVEIITAPGARPNPTWLNFVVTGKARSNIRNFIKGQRQAESVSLGKHLLEKALESLSFDLEHLKQKDIDKVLAELVLDDFDELLESIGLGNKMAMVVARRLTGLAPDIMQHEQVDEDESKEQHLPAGHAVSIKGSEGMMVSFAECCRPIPGDPIIGFLNAGHGLMIHTEDCNNISSRQKQGTNCIPVRWEEQVDGDFRVDIRVEAANQRGVLADLATAIAEAEANINDVKVKEYDNRYSLVYMTLTVRDRVHLARVMRRLRRVPAVNRLVRSK